jgi:hypothetical protein
LIRNLSTQTRPDGNALPTIIEKWISRIQSKVAVDQGFSTGTTEFTQAVKTKILQTLNGMEEMVRGFDFAQIINAYYQGYIEGDDAFKSSAIRWLRGEFNNKTEAYAVLKVRSIIDSDNYYDYLKILARFVREVGYSGLLVCLDEAAYLYKISNSISRKNNYESILMIVNDCLQGKASSIGFIFGGTPEFIEDQRRGLFSYEALRSRLSGNRFATGEMQDFSGPILTLPPLKNEEIFFLLRKIREIHNSAIPAKIQMDDTAIKDFMEDSLRRIGAREFSTPRELIRDYVYLLNLLVQYPNKGWKEIAGNLTHSAPTADPAAITEKEKQAEEEPLDRFKDFKVG